MLYYLQDGTKRFSELQRDNPTVPHRILTLELRKLEEAGIVDRVAYEGYPLIDAIGSWWKSRNKSISE